MDAVSVLYVDYYRALHKRHILWPTFFETISFGMHPFQVPTAPYLIKNNRSLYAQNLKKL